MLRFQIACWTTSDDIEKNDFYPLLKKKKTNKKYYYLVLRFCSFRVLIIDYVWCLPKSISHYG